MHLRLVPRLVVVALLTGAGLSCDSPVADPPPREPAAEMSFLEAHNQVRRTVRPAPEPPLPPLVEDPRLVAAAQAWADGCRFEHANVDAGENLFAANRPPTTREVVESWAAEATSYDFATGKCRGTCGHFTQIVWRDTLRLGCAKSRCATGSPLGGGPWWLVVCRYEPSGNYAGERPY